MGALFFLIFVLILGGIGYLTIIIGLIGLLLLQNREPKGKAVIKVIFSVILGVGIFMMVVPVVFILFSVVNGLLYTLTG